MTIAADLKALAAAHRHTARSLAIAAGVDESTVSTLFRGEGTLASLRLVLAAMNASLSPDLAAGRRTAGLSIAALAGLTRLNRNTVHAVERGNGKVKTFARIVRALGVEPTITAHRKVTIAHCPRCLHASTTIRAHHYTKSMPSGSSRIYTDDAGVIIVFSIPANNQVSKNLVGMPDKVWELSRMWAPDNHAPNALTRALSIAVAAFKREHPDILALVSYADPHQGHEGHVYRAANWIPMGTSSETRVYVNAAGQRCPRRSFHIGKKSMTRAQIEATGWLEEKSPAKSVYALPLTRKARALLTCAPASSAAQTSASAHPFTRSAAMVRL